MGSDIWHVHRHACRACGQLVKDYHNEHKRNFKSSFLFNCRYSWCGPVLGRTETWNLNSVETEAYGTMGNQGPDLGAICKFSVA